MSDKDPRFAPGTFAYYLDAGLWRLYRISAVVFLISVLVTLAIGTRGMVAGIAGLSFFLWVGGWIAHRLVLRYWQD